MKQRACCLLVAAVTLVVAACATQSLGDRLGVEVRGTGNNRIDLAWDAQHAWSPLMVQGGAELVAEYTTPARGLVREVLGRSGGSASRILSFTLPPTLKGSNTGAVCLYFQLPANRSILPVRKSKGPGDDTARFRFPGWESAATSRNVARIDQFEVTALERQAASLESAARGRSVMLAQRGWPTAGSCESIRMEREAIATTPPIGVLPPEQHDAAARQACINRMIFSKFARDVSVEEGIRESRGVLDKKLEKRLGDLSSLAGMGLQAAQIIQQFKTPSDPQAAAVLQARQRDASAFNDDWRRYAGTLGEGFFPAIGSPTDYLELIGEAQPAHKKLIIFENADKLGVPPDKRPALTANELLGLAGGMLDSYKGCVADGRNELKAKFAAWTELQRDSPERNRRIHDYYVKECRALHDQLARVEADRARVQADLGQARQRLSTSQAAVGQVAATESRILNETSCQ